MIESESPLSRRFWRDPVDARPAALLRIGVGLLVIYDLLDRLTDFYAFYSRAGIVPPEAARRFSLFLLSDSLLWAQGLYAAGLVITICYTLGYRTRFSTVGLFVFLLSLHHRNQPILNGSDIVIRLLVMWAMFVDQGARYSLDVWLGRRPPRATIWPLGLRFLQLQIAVIYVGALCCKLAGHWLDGTAVYLAMQSPTYGRPIAIKMLDYPMVCFALTVLTLVIEGMLPIFVFFPVANRLARAIALLAGVGLHLGIYVLMRVGHFSLVMLVSYLALLRSEWLDFLGSKARGEPASPPSPRRDRILSAIFGVHIIWAFYCAIFPWHESKVREAIQRVTLPYGFEQNWSMFYQPPLERLHWMALATLPDGTRREVLSELAPAFGESNTWFNSRWTKLQTVLANRPSDLYHVGPYLCRRYRAEHPGQSLEALEIYLERRDALFPDEHGEGEHHVDLALVQICHR